MVTVANSMSRPEQEPLDEGEVNDWMYGVSNRYSTPEDLADVAALEFGHREGADNINFGSLAKDLFNEQGYDEEDDDEEEDDEDEE